MYRHMCISATAHQCTARSDAGVKTTPTTLNASPKLCCMLCTCGQDWLEWKQGATDHAGKQQMHTSLSGTGPTCCGVAASQVMEAPISLVELLMRDVNCVCHGAARSPCASGVGKTDLLTELSSHTKKSYCSVETCFELRPSKTLPT